MDNESETVAFANLDSLENEPNSESDENPNPEQIPFEDVKTCFSLRKLWAFTGPGFLMSIAYLDPGNIESDLEAGAESAYKLLWVLLSAHIIGMLLQRMSARLGVVTGKHMAEVAYEFYPKGTRIIIWLMIEIAIVCSDMQEVIGTAIAIYLLSRGRVPIYIGVFLTILDTFTFLMIDRYGIRKLEFIFAFLISTMAISFGYEFFVMKPPIEAIVTGIVVPWCAGCGRTELMQAISLVGSIIQPHNLYLHSALVKSRKINRKNRLHITEANKYFTLESAIALTISFFINLFVVAVFAHGLFQKSNSDIRDMCIKHGDISGSEVFPNNTDPVDIDFYKGGIYLGCEFGIIAMLVWGVGIFAAGQSSTMTGTYTGQFVMEGFVKIQWPKWKRVIITRAIAITPTLILTFYSHVLQDLTVMNDFLNCMQMVQLPFALIPIITFTSSRKIMHDFRSSKCFQFFALLTSTAILAVNVYFIYDYISSNLGTEWYVFAGLFPVTIVYVIFVLYLAIFCLSSCEIIPEIVGLCGFNFSFNDEFDAPWIENPGYHQISEELVDSLEPIWECKFGESCKKSHAEEDEAPKHALAPPTSSTSMPPNFANHWFLLPKTLLMCPIYAETGKCHQTSCEYLHGNKCAKCNRWCIYPYCEEKQVAHVMECELEVEEFFKKYLDEQCSICLTEFELGDEFGFFSKCHHVFHMHCAKEALARRPLCPLCRTPGQIIYPNFFYVPFGEETELLGKMIAENPTKKCCKFGDACKYMN